MVKEKKEETLQAIRGQYEDNKVALTQDVNCIIDQEAQEIISHLDKQLHPFFLSLWENRKKRAQQNGRLRDMTVQYVLQIFGVQELTYDHKLVIAAGEFYNMASYYQNWHLDDKKNVKGGYEAKLCHIASHLYREKAHDLIMRSKFSQEIKLHLLDELRASNHAIQVGQSLEMAGLRVKDLQGASQQKVIDVYTQRSKEMSGRFYGASFAFGAIMAQASPQHIATCREIGTQFGTSLQMINDVGDFCLVPSLVQLSEKDYQDQFADLMKGTMTLPVFELAKHIDIEQYHSRILSNEQKEMLLQIMVENRAFDSVRKITNNFRRSIVSKINEFPKNTARDMLKFQIKTINQCNKFYVNLRENHGYVWGDQ